MNAFEAISRLNESSCMAIRGRNDSNLLYTYNTILKSECYKYGLQIDDFEFSPEIKWEVARICENCSGNGTVFNLDAIEGEPMHIECPECEGEKMIWGQK